MGATTRNARWLAGQAIAALAMFACASSSNSGGGSNGFPFSGPSCTDGAAFSDACWSCAQSGCASLTSCYTGSCSDYFTCYCSCPAADSTCIDACASSLTSDCQGCLTQTQNSCRACDGQCGSGDGGATNVQPPSAFIATTVGATGGGTPCDLGSVDTTFLSVGTAATGKPTTVTDQGTAADGAVTVDCTVTADGSGFDVILDVSIAGPNGGSVNIASPAGQGAVTTAGGTGISASFTGDGGHGPYTSGDCTIRFTYQGQPVPVTPPIAPGRIWGHIDCPDATAVGQGSVEPDGGSAPITCPASADFLFENCNP
jgi:hypothetical protein